MKQAKCGKYVLIGKIVVQLLFTTQIVWLSQAMAMFVECSYMIDIGSPWKALGSLYYYFDSPSEKWNA